MRDAFAASVFLLGLPNDMRLAVMEVFEKNGVAVVGSCSGLLPLDLGINDCQVIICFCESESQLKVQTKLIARYDKEIIACVRNAGVSAEDAGVYAVVTVPVRQTPKQAEETLIRLVYLVRSARLKSRLNSLDGLCRDTGAIEETVKVIAIGASAGGTRAIERVAADFTPDFPCALAVQHMAKGFTELFVNSLKSRCAITVSEARDGDFLKRGHMYVAAWGKHMRLVNDGGFRVRLEDGENVSGHKPSVDALFSSVAKAAGRNAIGVILTGMGRDGAAGLLEMRNAGAATIGQDKESCTVYGMPMEAFNIGAVQKQAPLEMISGEIKSILYARRAV